MKLTEELIFRFLKFTYFTVVLVTVHYYESFLALFFCSATQPQDDCPTISHLGLARKIPAPLRRRSLRPLAENGQAAKLITAVPHELL